MTEAKTKCLSKSEERGDNGELQTYETLTSMGKLSGKQQ